MDKVNVLVSVNKRYLTHVEELIASLLKYSSKYIDIYLMYIESELNFEDLQYIKNFVKKIGNGKLIPVKFDTNDIDAMPVSNNDGRFFGAEAYSRLFCVFKLPKELEKILYLDADMVCTGDIVELYNMDFEGKMWIACRDYAIQEINLRKLNLPLDYEYVNSGMLLINLPKIREKYTESDIVRMIIDMREVLRYPDQDFINKVFRNQIKVVDSKYNLIARDVRYKDLKEKPLIIHYAGVCNPWDEDVSNFDKEYMEAYYEAMRLQGEYKKDKLDKLIKIHSVHGYRN